MRKFLLSFTVLFLAISTSRAGVEINETNFPDENLRQYLMQYDSDGDGVLEDNGYQEMGIFGVDNLKGMELITWVTNLRLENSQASEINPSYLPSTLKTLVIDDYSNLTSLDLKSLKDLTMLNISGNMAAFTALTLSPDIEEVYLSCPKLEGVDFSQYKSLQSINLYDCYSIQDIEINDMPALGFFYIYSSPLEEKWAINSISVARCPNLTVNPEGVKVNRFTVSEVYSFYGGGEIADLRISSLTFSGYMELSGNVENLTLMNMPQLNSLTFNNGSVSNISGLDQLSNLAQLILIGYGATSISSNNMPAHLKELTLRGCERLTTLDLDGLHELSWVDVQESENLSSLKMPEEIQNLTLTKCPKLADFDFVNYQNLESITLTACGMQDIVINNMPKLLSLGINTNSSLDYDYRWNVNSIQVTNCPSLTVELRIFNVKARTLAISDVHAPYFYGLYSEIDTITVQDCPDMGSFSASGASGETVKSIALRNMPLLRSVSVSDDQLETLDIKECPNLYHMDVTYNNLSWLDLSDVVYNANQQPDNYFWADGQTVDVEAVKISPTEVGLRVDSRLDVSKVLDLTAKGEAMQPKEIFVDGIRYFVFYNNGPQTESLVGAEGNGYRYNVEWPYPWTAANPDSPSYESSKDNLMPVTLRVNSWTRHQAFLKLSAAHVSGIYGEPLEAPVLTRSQDYDGKVTFSSSNEGVVKVDAETGKLTVVGAGTAVITVRGAETDYRLAPATLTYSVFIDKAQPVIAFPAAKVNTVYGETVSNNPLTVTWYEGTVNYTSADPAKAVVDAEGVVTTKGAGDVVISGIAPETANFYRAQVEYTLHIDKARPVISFPAAELNAVYGDEFAPENKLNVTWYEGQVTYVSDDITKAEVSAQGKVRILGAGDVTVSGIAPETDNFYPAQTNYLLHIAKASPVFNFEKDAISLNLGESVPENALTTGLYDGEVVFSLSNDTVATIDASGVLTVIGAGEVVVTATGAATDNCNEPVKAEYKLTVTDPTGISKISADNPDSEAVYDMLGRRVQNPVRRGIYIIGNRKVIVK